LTTNSAANFLRIKDFAELTSSLTLFQGGCILGFNFVIEEDFLDFPFFRQKLKVKLFALSFLKKLKRGERVYLR